MFFFQCQKHFRFSNIGIQIFANKILLLLGLIFLDIRFKGTEL